MDVIGGRTIFYYLSFSTAKFYTTNKRDGKLLKNLQNFDNISTYKSFDKIQCRFLYNHLIAYSKDNFS